VLTLFSSRLAFSFPSSQILLRSFCSSFCFIFALPSLPLLSLSSLFNFARPPSLPQLLSLPRIFSSVRSSLTRLACPARRRRRRHRRLCKNSAQLFLTIRFRFLAPSLVAIFLFLHVSSHLISSHLIFSRPVSDPPRLVVSPLNPDHFGTLDIRHCARVHLLFCSVRGAQPQFNLHTSLDFLFHLYSKCAGSFVYETIMIIFATTTTFRTLCQSVGQIE
jgi:hypothetical protein